MKHNYPELAPGDYCTAYYKGIFQVIRVVDRRHMNAAPLVHLVQVMDGAYNKRRSLVQCDAAYCKKVTKESLLEAATATHQLLVSKINSNFPS
jgi:hypothetical protein